MVERISDAEHAVMEVLWDESPLTAQDVAERVDPARGWSANTVKTLLGRLLANVEAYPELKSQANFSTFMAQIEGTENRINIAVTDYNTAVQAYNTRIRTFPDAIGAKVIYGAKPLVPFQATTPNADRAPTVDFGNGN